MAEWPTPEFPMPVPVTTHLSLCLSLYSILHTQYSLIFCSTEPLGLRASYVCPMSPCHHAHMSPRDLWSRRGSAIQRYGLTPCEASKHSA